MLVCEAIAEQAGEVENSTSIEIEKYSRSTMMRDQPRNWPPPLKASDEKQLVRR